TPNVIFTEPPTGAATPYLGGSICGLAAAPPAPGRSGIRETGIGDGGQQAARAGRSVVCRRGAAPPRDKDQPEMSERKHGGATKNCFLSHGLTMDVASTAYFRIREIEMKILRCKTASE